MDEEDPGGFLTSKTGAREVALGLLLIWIVASVVLLFRPNQVANYDGMYIAMTTNVFLFALGAFALKTASNVSENNARVRYAMNPRLSGEGEVPGVG